MGRALLPIRPKNAVVIGAGIAGLSAALRLAHAGLQVRVIDLHDQPGGKMRTVPSDAGPVDAGPTVMTMRHVFETLFEDIGEQLSDHVTLHREETLARHFWPDGSRLDLFDDPEKSASAIGDFAGDRSEREFRQFQSKARALFDGFEQPMMMAASPSFAGLVRHVVTRPNLARLMAPGKTLARALAQQFSDPRLRQLFGRYATYVGGSPYQSPSLLSLIWESEARGVWRVEGGMHKLAQAMHDLAKARGAEFHFGIAASRIEKQGSAVSAVHLSDGRKLPADLVVFNGDPRALAQGFLGEAATSTIPADSVEPRSLSAWVWSFAAKPSGVDLAHHNVFFGQDPRSEFDPIKQGKMPEDPTLYICAQDRGGDTPSGLERFEIIMNAPANMPGSQEEIDLCRATTFPILRQRGLAFSEEPPDHALSTPAIFNSLFPASGGSLYGLSPHGMMAAFKRPTVRSALKGLYLAGGGVHPGAGIPMACLSGQHAAAAILSDLTSTSMSPKMATRGGMSTA